MSGTLIGLPVAVIAGVLQVKVARLTDPLVVMDKVVATAGGGIWTMDGGVGLCSGGDVCTYICVCMCVSFRYTERRGTCFYVWRRFVCISMYVRVYVLYSCMSLP